MFVMSAKDASILNFEDEYRKIKPIPEKIIPVKHLEEKVNEKGIRYWELTTLSEEEQRIEKEQKIKHREWMKRKDRYVCKRILETFTWDDFVNKCKKSYEQCAIDLISQFHPCDDSTKQCRLDCEDILRCPYK